MATIVETAPIRQPSWIAQVVVFIVKYSVWITVFFFAILLLATIYLLWKRMKKRIDPFADDYKKVRALCKFQKDPTIKNVYLFTDKGIKHIGKYLGEAVTQDGYRNILFWKFKRWYLFWYPVRFDFFDVVKETMIIRCNINDEFKYKEYNEKTKEETLKTIKLAKNLITRSEDKILIRGFGFEKVKYFLYPILRDKDGNIADKSLEIFERERSPAIMSTMYQQAEDFANISRELININPNVRYITKTGEPIIKEKPSG